MGAPRQILVSGATGFVGRHVVPLLLQRGHKVVALGRDTAKAKTFSWYPDVKFITADMGTVQFTPEPGAALMHLAWEGLPNYDSQSHIDTNLPKSTTFVKTMIDKGVATVLVTGTCQEYGFQQGAIAASAAPQPTTPYAIAKDQLRQQLTIYQQEKPFTLQWARLFYMYGAGQNPKSILAQLDAAIEKNEPSFNMSGGEQLRDYLPVEAVATQLVDRLESNNDGVFNICSSKPVSIRALVENRIRERGAKIALNLGYYPYPEYEPMEFWGVPS